jgi:light-regulated signal transduction histidine kinase (bacteriophytochrome)
VNYPAREEDVDPGGAEFRLLENALSHDLEGSIRGLKSLAGILLQKHATLLTGEASEVVQLLGAEADRGNRLLDGLLSWLEAVQQPLLFGWQDTTRVAREVFATISALSPERPVEFTLPALPALWCDPLALRRIFRELLSNAVKFTGTRSHPTVAISACEDEDETVITVQDNGVGFEITHASQLFVLFRRMHRKREFEGEGAGLAVVRQIVQRHRGRIWAEAQIDRGAAFHIAFPKHPTDEAPV